MGWDGTEWGITKAVYQGGDCGWRVDGLSAAATVGLSWRAVAAWVWGRGAVGGLASLAVGDWVGTSVLWCSRGSKSGWRDGGGSLLISEIAAS